MSLKLSELKKQFEAQLQLADDLYVEEVEAQAVVDSRARETGLKISELERQIKIEKDSIEDAFFQIERANGEIIELQKSLKKEKNFLSDIYWENSDYNKDIQKEVAQLTTELQTLKKKKFEADTTVEDVEQYQNFKNLSPEEQQEVIDKQKDKTAIVSITPSDEIKEGTLGKAMGNVQKALTQAYIDEIMKTASIGELQRAIENIPGANLLGKIISRFECGKDPLIYPPIDSFLSTLTFDPCGTEKTRIALPEIRELQLNFNWLEQLGNAMYVALREVASRVIVALIIKTTELLKTDLCQAIGDISSAGLGAIEDGGFGAFVSDLICQDPKTDDDRDGVNKTLLEAGGARGKSDASYRDLANLLSVSATQKEIKQAMVGRPESSFINNISSLVKNSLPQFGDLFADRQSTNQFFQTMGNFLTPEQRNNIIDELDNPLDDFPVDLSICLTKEAKDLWDQNRIGAFSDPEVGREFVAKQDERNKSNLADAADLLLNGVDGALDKAINDAFGPKDPDCKTNTSVIPGFNDYPKNKQQAISNAITGIFKRLEKAFIDDTIEDNFFNPFNPSGILLEILSDKRTLNLAKHLLAKNNFFFRIIFGQIGAELEFPETVGIQLKEYIDSYETTYKIDQDIVLFYDNQKENSLLNESKFTSTLVINESVPANGEILIEDRWSGISFTSDNFLEIPQDYQVESSPLPLGAATLGKMIESLWSEFQIQFEPETFRAFFQGMNTEI